VFADLGDDMPNELHVDTAGLRSAAANSTLAAATLASPAICGSASSQPSGTGVTAVNAALAAVLQRQSSRISGQASDLTSSSALYDTTDAEGADAITSVSV